MSCNLCGQEYRGLAGDCACTMYGYINVEEMPKEVREDYIRGQQEKERREARYKIWRIKARLRKWVWYGGLFILGTILGALAF